MGTVFISYRRDDSQGFAGRLEDDLSEHLGDARVFRDREIPAGTDFVEHLEQHLADAEAVLVVIGPTWLTLRGADGIRRLDAAGDWVRREIERALGRGVPVVPVLVGGATMPAAEALPASIASLARRQAFVLDDARWARGIEELLAQLAQLAPALARRPVHPPAPTPREVQPAPRQGGGSPLAAALLRWLGGRLSRLFGVLATLAVGYVLVRALGGRDANRMLDRVIDTTLEQLRLLMG
ncbi:MAG: toll/interleukin-1 receptor domain-containing protein [Rhodocyclaceae bacterium]|nr:toll/interleukin-1 receptor domain-containing protein [Rhodocyclaceae bacterium]